MNQTLYLLVHRHHFSDAPGAATADFREDGEPLFWDDSDDSFTLLGLYSTRQLAEQRIEQARTLPGFRRFPDGFYIHEYAVGESHWPNGFVGNQESKE